MTESQVDATEGAIEAAKEMNVSADLNEGKIEGSGQNGRVQKNDVEDYVQQLGEEEDAAEDTPEEFDEPTEPELPAILAKHLTDTGLDILSDANPDDDEIQSAVEAEREKRAAVESDEEDASAIELLKKFARIRTRQMSRSQVANRSQNLLTRLGYDWRRDD